MSDPKKRLRRSPEGRALKLRVAGIGLPHLLGIICFLVMFSLAGDPVSKFIAAVFAPLAGYGMGMIAEKLIDDSGKLD